MAHLRILPLVLTVALTGSVCASLKAQTEAAPVVSPTQYKVREVPNAQPPMPFPPDSEPPGQVAAVEFRSADQMSQKDRELEADAESSIWGWISTRVNGVMRNWSARHCPTIFSCALCAIVARGM